MREHIRNKLAIILKQTKTDPLSVAKAWACQEAIYKAIGYNPEGVIEFDKKKPPVYKGKEHIVLSLTHEGDYVIAIALSINQFQQQQFSHQSLNLL